MNVCHQKNIYFLSQFANTSLINKIRVQRKQMYVRTVKVINKFTNKIYLVVEIFESSTLVQLI